MHETARLLAQRQVIIITGAYGGSGMDAPAKGAWVAGGKSVGYSLANVWGTGNIFSKQEDCSAIGLHEYGGISKPSSEVGFGIRLGKLFEGEHFVFGAEGSQGTGVELLTYINLAAKLWPKEKKVKRAAILCPPGSKGAWGDEMLATFQQWGFLPASVMLLIRVVTRPQDAVDWIWQ